MPPDQSRTNTDCRITELKLTINREHPFKQKLETHIHKALNGLYVLNIIIKRRKKNK